MSMSLALILMLAPWESQTPPVLPGVLAVAPDACASVHGDLAGFAATSHGSKPAMGFSR